MTPDSLRPIYDTDRPILYIMVIGFHHKKGCQLEFVYPNDSRVTQTNQSPLQSVTADLTDHYKLPKKWKHLPSLALPDGSHNYETDYIYFHLEDDPDGLAEHPGSTDPKTTKKRSNKTLFGVSCYRQINASELLIKDVDVTRNTLQKSVCILVRLPIYSSLRVKLYSITTAYFEQKDFHKTELLVNAYESILQQTSYFCESTATPNLASQHRLLNHEDKSKFFIGLSLGDLVLRYQHKLLVLFKLMLLQKKCLFQLKPVSNLSNTIISLVSLIPDIFLPGSNSSSGLDHCSGFFDSIDLVNYELEQKTNRKKAAAAALAVSAASTNNDRFISVLNLDASTPPITNSDTLKRTKKLKKRLKSFSKKHQQTTNNGTTLTNSVSSGSLVSSFSLHSIKTIPNQNEATPTTTTASDTQSIKTPVSLITSLASGTQRMFAFNSSGGKASPKVPANADQSELDLSRLTEDKLLETPVSGGGGGAKSKLDFKSNIYSSKQSNSSSSNGSLSNPKASNDDVFDESRADDPNSQPITDLIKNKMTNVLKLVDWSSPVIAATTTDSKKSAKKSSVSDSPDTTLQQVVDSVDKTPATINTNTLKRTRRLNRKKLDQSIHETIANTTKDLPPPTDIQFNDLLDIDFGTPFSIFNELNLLHPYLSLYYLDYFTGINKMNTKLYCTTALMMSMMKDNREDPAAAEKAELEEPESEQNEASMSSGPPRRSSQNNQEPTNIGYTIGATNALFKQRLYDDVDAFIDELDIDLRGNESLKKQLQLTTADLRFIDFIVKNVNVARNGDKQANNAPTLLSFKKIISTNNLEQTAASTTQNSAMPSTVTPSEAGGHSQNINQMISNWEGSDDWIRLNFKWYLYSLLGCVIKEDLSNAIRAELEAILFSSELAATLSSSSGESNSSRNSSTLSINEKSAIIVAPPVSEVVNIDDYIDRVNNSSSETPKVEHAIVSTELSNNKSNELTKSSTTVSTLSALSTQYFYCLEELNSYLDYRDDYNSNYIGEVRKTSWFKSWHEANRSKLERTLYKFDVVEMENLLVSRNAILQSSATANADVAATAVILANRFNVLFTKYQELELTRLHHPFNGQMSVSDIKLKFNFMLGGTESGRKLGKALTEGGKIVNHTSKAVGEALSQAKSTFSSFFNNWSSSGGGSSPSKNQPTGSSKSITKN